MPRLSKAQREAIIFEFIKGNPTPGYEVIELSNGKYNVKIKPIEVEEEEETEEEEYESDDGTNGVATVNIPDHKTQNAMDLLKQLTELMNAQNEQNQRQEYDKMIYQQPARPVVPQNWNRKKLRFN